MQSCARGHGGGACPRMSGSVLRMLLLRHVLARQFEAPAPNQKWVADCTYIWTAEGWLYVAAVLDLYSRRAPWAGR